MIDEDKRARQILGAITSTPLEPEFFLERDEVSTYSIEGSTKAKDYLKISISARKNIDWPAGSVVRFNHQRYDLHNRSLVLVSAVNLAPGCATLLLICARRPLTPQEIEQIMRGT